MVKKGTLRRFLSFFGLLVIAATIGVVPAWAQPIFVTTAADAGVGSLRQAIIDANADAAANPIIFNTSVLACPITINVVSQLDPLTGAGDTIDGSACGVTINGTLAGAVGLRVRASNVTVRGLTIQNFDSDGIRVEPASGASGVSITGVVITKNVIANNLDGLRVSGGDTPLLFGFPPNNTVRVLIANNEFFRNRDDGIFVRGSAPTGGGNIVDADIVANTIRGSLGVVTGGALTGDGIRVIGGLGNGNIVSARIANNTVQRNADDGIIVAGSQQEVSSNNNVHATIVGNSVKENGTPASIRGSGIVVRGGTRDGVPFGGSDNVVSFFIANNEVADSKDHGIFVTGGLGNSHTVGNIGTIKGNKLTSNGVSTSRSGILVSGGVGTANTLSDISILENEVRNSGRSGIQITGGPGGDAILSNITVKGNESRLNREDGINVTQGTGGGNSVSVTGITDNESNNNGKDGIFVGPSTAPTAPGSVSGSGATPISANQANRNREDGIDINSGGYVLIANTANANAAGAGIDAVGNTDGGGNTAVGNASCNTPGCF